MRITADWLTAPGLVAVLDALTGAGQRALLVGGCVRNALIGAPVSDLDIATDAEPDRVIALMQAAGLKTVPTGLVHGTVTVVAGGVPHEVTTFRRDVETFGRNATVAFSTRIEDDAARRDFTMNALYAEGGGRVIDPLGTGLADLAARRLRFVGEPADRIAEDYLRILRFFRFHAWYADPAGGLDPEGLAACAAGAEGIERLSRERVGAEMLKLLAAPDPAPAVAAMRASGVLARVLPGADDRALAPLLHLEEGAAPDPLRRLAVLGGAAPDEALRLSRAQARDLADLRAAATGGQGPAELGWRLGADRARDALMARAALLEQPLPQGWQEAVARGAAAQFPLTAADLMPAFAGPALGAELKAREARWIASDLTASRDDLLGDDGTGGGEGGGSDGQD
ncbi:CCA tRNA nucleotidyltransferase [Frigidibacter oleivorans]|uniref:CCA tRNA nucleotidyltransferase n=1 Tax=Frigidibacter oleivorans TaxID=2487129 RepID=UPI000F8EDC9D|nr:CCA tRNA nucleotidyltransferase [Frigidibacter oleivorans]